MRPSSGSKCSIPVSSGSKCTIPISSGPGCNPAPPEKSRRPTSGGASAPATAVVVVPTNVVVPTTDQLRPVPPLVPGGHGRLDAKHVFPPAPLSCFNHGPVITLGILDFSASTTPFRLLAVRRRPLRIPNASEYERRLLTQQIQAYDPNMRRLGGR